MQIDFCRPSVILGLFLNSNLFGNLLEENTNLRLN